MDWNYTITLLVSEATKDKANHLAAAIGLSMADINTFQNCTYEKGDKCYGIEQSLLKDSALSKAGEALTRPDFDVDEQIDMVKAEEARQLIVWDDFSDIDNKIVCVLSGNPDPSNTIKAAAAKAGVTAIPFEF